MATTSTKCERDGSIQSPGAARRSSPLRYLLFSLLFHLLFTVSIFDIYFTSPVVHPTKRYSLKDSIDGEPVDADIKAPADRLVLIVGDGLRADTLYKEHPPSMLPDWAKKDLQQSSADAYPWTSALKVEKQLEKSSIDTSKPPGPFFAAPHLRNIALNRGTWGISHTRVPTESRPGHVALIAGMYEDVSAVTKGWKLNPVDFDSLMNVSTHAYTFGSPDILPMFAKGAEPGRVDMWMYNEAAEDFTKDATHLDLWVLHRLEELFDAARSNHTLAAELKRPGNVFFLHLLGLDTTGHTYRPHSPEYVGNLIVVDAITRRVEELFTDFFQEEDQEESRTAFIFSADHGMSTKGNHGDGEPDNTRTPIVAWGSGLRGPRTVAWDEPQGAVQLARRAKEEETDAYYDDWKGLEMLDREDIEQADVTALMATLLALPLPANSEGRLPLGFVHVIPEVAARAMLANALEVLEIYRVKDQQRRDRLLRYAPFHKLHDREEPDALPGAREIAMIKNQIKAYRFKASMDSSNVLIDVALEGAKYLQTYDWLLLVSIITAGYLGSILYGVIHLLRSHALTSSEAEMIDHSSARSGVLSLGNLLAGSTLALFCAKFFAEQAPLTYYAYVASTALLWSRVIDQRRVIRYVWTKATRKDSLSVARRLAILFIFLIAALELIVFGYLQRYAWSLGFFILGFGWPFSALDDAQRSKNEGLLLLWGLSCVGAALFTLAGVEKEESLLLLGFTGLLFMAAGVAAVRYPGIFLAAKETTTTKGQREDPMMRRTQHVIKAQTALIAVSTTVTLSSSYHLQNKLGLPLVNQIIGWGVLCSATTLPFLFGFQRGEHRQPAAQRLAIIIFAAAPLFILLSLRDEALFFGVYTLTLLIWAKMEGAVLEEKVVKARNAGHLTGSLALPRTVGLEEVRTALVFLFLLHVGFFGTGNIASISSFYLSPVYRLIPVFAPFTMAALLILKILVPFIVLCSVFHFLCTGQPSGRVLGTYRPGEEGQLAGPPLFGPHAIGGLGLESSHGLVLIASIAADVLALNFLFSVQTSGAWLEIGRSITHFAMANLLIVFMFGLSAIAEALY
ncbi:PigN-domain-containing protein [Microstroma glucosiphilum]|uniref:GPI ethanolamine phosphate transferase 1 n=1 Tax=Pseudomicrostroma glucosiphilum TaxID=1684307 RepID=A0A316UC55_9BASI|nr:PigN-domain-containing protein [Pseudomicrostroma glucosiphilum]PWN20585.1 PigN-domain-containing protein [Pseudomicrostroma glucosiphilum]